MIWINTGAEIRVSFPLSLFTFRKRGRAWAHGKRRRGVPGATGAAGPPRWGWWASRRPTTLATGSGSPNPGRCWRRRSARPLPQPQDLPRHPQLHPLPRVLRQPAAGPRPVPGRDALLCGPGPVRGPHQLLQPGFARARPADHAAGRRGGGPGGRPAAYHGPAASEPAAPACRRKVGHRWSPRPGPGCCLPTAAPWQPWGHWPDGLLGRTTRAPEMLRHPAAVDSLEQELVTGLAGALQLRGARGRPRASHCAGAASTAPSSTSAKPI